MLGVGLQSVAKYITKCAKDYKVWKGGLQSALGITKCGGITKWVSAEGKVEFLKILQKRRGSNSCLKKGIVFKIGGCFKKGVITYFHTNKSIPVLYL